LSQVTRASRARIDTAAIDERIRTLVEHHRPELEHLVDAEIDRQLDALVAERLEARNGNGAAPTPSVEGTEMGTCASCGRSRPLSKFEHGRRKVCTTCRSRAHTARIREREQPASLDPEPEPRLAIPADELARRSAVNAYGVNGDELERWLLAGGLALEHDGLLVPTERCLELSGAISG
jgi:hypothetical protein